MFICIVAQRNIYHYFVEYIHSILYWFDKYDIQHDIIFHDDPKIYEKIEKADLNICIQMLLLDDQKVTNPKKRIMIFNTEQYTRKTYYYNHILSLLNNGYNILDYQSGNMLFMNKETNGKFDSQMFYLPYLYCNVDKILMKKKRTKDICFVGTVTQYRYDILNELRKEIQIDILNDFGDRRDNRLSDYKIVLNLSADPSYQVFETIRCYRCIFNKILVVSDEKLYKENNKIDSMCMFVDKSKLLEMLKYTLENYNKILKEKYDLKENEFISWSDEQFKNFLEKVKHIN